MGGKEKWELGEGESEEKVSTYMDGMRPSLLLILACLPMSDIVRQCAHVSF